jgi:hypothetical protein
MGVNELLRQRTINPRIADMVERIAKTAQPDQVILFGSRALGAAADSEISSSLLLRISSGSGAYRERWSIWEW